MAVQGYTTGTFDLLSIKHLELLKYMRSRCDVLTVGLTTDRLARVQKREPMLDFAHRRALLQHCKWVDHVVAHDGDDKSTAWEKLRFDVCFIGEDYYGTAEYANAPVPVIYVPPSTADVSTTAMVQSLEHSVIRHMYVLCNAIHGPVMRLRTPDSDIVIKPVRVSRAEAQEPVSTGNVFNLSIPPPRNWKRKDAVHRHPNIAGVNVWRELQLMQVLPQQPWNPVIDIRCVWSQPTTGSVTAEDTKDVVAARSRAAEVHWIYMQYAGPTMHQWITEHKPETQAIVKVIERVHAILDELLTLRVVHGDVHSHNICVNPDTLAVSLIDWGWCLYHAFELNDEEHQYYLDQLNNGFDRQHFKDSLEYTYGAQPWLAQYT